jgi:6-pyruvoyltetrahydropterin/6-carboxytetrahydropterin synthase
MYTIRKEFACSCGHQLVGLPEEHPCSRPHGHNYVITVELKAKTLNGVGFVKDYRELDHIKKFIDEQMDHRNLNDVFPFNPTAELLAKHLFDIFIEKTNWLVAVEVSETPKTHARYEP